MDEAAILVEGRVVKLSNLVSPVFSIDSFLVEFTFQGKVYKHYYNYDFKESDKKSALAGYYNQERFLEYYQNVNGLTRANLEAGDYFQNFIKAQSGDSLSINQIDVSTPYTFYSYKTYKLSYNPDLPPYLDGKIVLPAGLKGIPGHKSFVNEQDSDFRDCPGNFYANHVSLVQQTDGINTGEKEKIIFLIARISIWIFHIVEDIFPLFQTSQNSDPVNRLIYNQKQKWSGSVQVTIISSDSFLEYYNDVYNFYRSCYYAQLALSTAMRKQKLALLLLILSSESLGTFSISDRLDILEYLVLQTHLFNSDEEIALKVINSIDINVQADVNDFLGGLIERKYPTNSQTPPYQESLYSLLYRKIENYKAIAKAIPELVGNKTFSKDNRTRFVTAILILWTESKYNPYKNIDANGNPDYTLIDNSTYKYDKNLSRFAIINYKSSKNKFGIYDDNFTFEFDPQGDGIYYIVDQNFSLSPSPTYNTYQPITLLYYPSETDLSIQIPKKDGELKGVIPMFYLAYIDSDGDEKDFNTKVGLLVDVVTTVAGIGGLSELRHLRYLSRLGQVLIIIETVQVAASVMSLILNYTGICDDSPFCEKLKTTLFFIEITSLVTDLIAIAKTKKAARAVVDEGLENGWPSAMLEEAEGVTPKDKIEEIAGISIDEYLANYVTKSKSDLLKKIDDENEFYRSIGLQPTMVKYYNDAQMEEVLTYAAGKGLSKEDGMGILHQACRKRPVEYIAPIDVMEHRMDNLIFVRKRGYPFTFEDKTAFDVYAKTKIEVTLDKFGFSKEKVFYSGSSITSESSISGKIFDTDWQVLHSKSEMQSFMTLMEERYLEALNQNLITAGKYNKDTKAMRSYYMRAQKLHRRYIIAIENDKVVSLETVLSRDFPDEIKTDLTPVIDGFNVGYPRVKYNF